MGQENKIAPPASDRDFLIAAIEKTLAKMRKRRMVELDTSDIFDMYGDEHVPNIITANGLEQTLQFLREKTRFQQDGSWVIQFPIPETATHTLEQLRELDDSSNLEIGLLFDKPVPMDITRRISALCDILETIKNNQEHSPEELTA